MHPSEITGNLISAPVRPCPRASRDGAFPALAKMKDEGLIVAMAARAGHNLIESQRFPNQLICDSSGFVDLEASKYDPHSGTGNETRPGWGLI